MLSSLSPPGLTDPGRTFCMTIPKPKKGHQKRKDQATRVPETDLEVFDEFMASFADDQSVESLLTNEQLLDRTFGSLLQLSALECAETVETEYDPVIEALEQKFTSILDELVEGGLVDEEEYVDIMTGLEEEEEAEEAEDSDFEDEEEESENDVQKELRMLMEPVGDNSQDEDDDEYDEEDEDEENEDYHESGKRDIFAEDEETSTNQSTFEKAQKALRSQIEALEKENVDAERPWALRGEINARQRPSDSLLEEAVEFEHTARATPQITEERTEAIEDIIKRRILEAAWDDVERKDGRDLTLLNGMEKGAKAPRQLLEDVATAQPQRSLAQVYEDDLQTKLTGESSVDAETKAARAELTSLFAKICRHIDGLSGNRFAPKVYAHSEIQIKTLGGKK